MSAMLLVLAGSTLLTPAHAAEVTWEGHYRARGLVYNSLSLANPTDNANSLGMSAGMDHRFRLQPTFNISSNVAIAAQLDFLPLGYWGDSINTWTDPVTGSPIPQAYADGVTPYDNAEDGGSYLHNISLVRVYGDIYTPIGRLRFGRMPLNWGAGLVYNDGLDVNSEYGDSADRVQLTSRVGPVYVMGGWETLNEGFISQRDDMQAFDLAVAWRSETAALGLYNRYRFQPDTFNAYAGDLWGFAELGPVKVELEVAGVVGRGDLDTGVNDVTISSVGGILRATAGLDKVYGGLEVGYANGDKDPNDSEIHTFTFDRDHNVALMMFEEPMPLLAAAVPSDANGGLDTSAVRTGDAISNAIYFTPWVGYKVRPDLSGELALIGARQAIPQTGFEDNKGYGWELDATITYAPFEHFELRGTGGLFLPGTYYSNYTNADLGGGFDGPAGGGRILGVAKF